MNLLEVTDLKALINSPKGLCVSIYLPTQRAGKEISQNPIRFKNLLRDAARQLRAGGMGENDVDRFLKSAQRLTESTKFWQHQSDGLAVFICPDDFKYYRLPHKFDELVVVTGRFHIKPLLSIFGSEGRYYILALSQKTVRLFQATHHGASEVDLGDVPRSLEEALKYELPEKQLQFRTEGPRRGGSRDAMFYGTGDSDPDVKNAILRYFQAVDKGVRDKLKEDLSPLVLAAVDFLIPIYRKASKYPGIVESSVKGNPDSISADELNEKAWEIIKPHFQKAREESAAKYRSLRDTGSKLATNDLKDIVRAAYHGRVESLFVPVGVYKWGRFDPGDDGVHLHEKEKPGDQDLLDFAAVHCFLNKGAVFAVRPDSMPDETAIAAVFRY